MFVPSWNLKFKSLMTFSFSLSLSVYIYIYICIYIHTHTYIHTHHLHIFPLYVYVQNSVPRLCSCILLGKLEVENGYLLICFEIQHFGAMALC